MNANIVEMKKFLIERLEAEAKRHLEPEKPPATCLVSEADYARFFTRTPTEGKEAV